MSATKPVLCECCGGELLRPAGVKRGWKLLQCQMCRLYCVHPQPTDADLKRIYSLDEGYFYEKEDKVPATPGEEYPLSDQLMSHTPPGRRFLDVGCARGDVLLNMRHQGWQVTGTEINSGAAAIARKHGLEVHEAELESAPFVSHQFDAVRFGQVLEHLRSPSGALKKAWDLLAPGGLLHITVPNADTAFGRMTNTLSKAMNVNWAHSEAPYHLYEFGPSNLRQLLERAGFSIITMRTYGKRSLTYTVGASGYLDRLKSTVKKGRWHDKMLVYPSGGVKLCAVTVAYAPLWGIGGIWDQFGGVGYKIAVMARRMHEKGNPAVSQQESAL